jgi:hypothetical protein
MSKKITQMSPRNSFLSHSLNQNDLARYITKDQLILCETITIYLPWDMNSC